MDRITPAQQHVIVTAVRAGAFPLTAAASAGVARPTAIRWLRRGRRQRRGLYRTFWLKVHQAQGQARVLAELDARQKDVKFWLRYGPGKTAPPWGPVGKRSRQRSTARQLQVETMALIGQLARQFPEASETRGKLLEILDRGPRA